VLAKLILYSLLTQFNLHPHIVNKKARVHILYDILWLNVFLLNASIIQ